MLHSGLIVRLDLFTVTFGASIINDVDNGHFPTIKTYKDMQKYCVRKLKRFYPVFN